MGQPAAVYTRSLMAMVREGGPEWRALMLGALGAVAPYSTQIDSTELLAVFSTGLQDEEQQVRDPEP